MFMDAETRLDLIVRELQTVLHAVSSANTLDRIWAYRYTRCRDLVLQLSPRPAVPGFLRQCVSVDNFHDFIRFYHPAIPHRHAFIDEALEACRSFRIEEQMVGESSVALGKIRAVLLAQPPRAVAEI
ncbi:hypothetical protein [Sphingosinicella rhizophila]|uniref:Uncharacterized protein n=1 Tax=Sphingosinicella rhizophila TaxID=3050082 RepID=A0ABU3Q6S5_9SPHN|nr:hypothetical protein [Sphingosinicella sp. GR2756]MDT9599022.1 hypothetical protein [Sphingosinicella sp. GR2756]